MSNARDENERSRRRPETAGRGEAGASAAEIGAMHYSTGNYATALEYFHAALAQGNPSPDEQFELLLRISDCHRARGEYDEAERFVHAARTLHDPEPDDPRAGRLGYREASMAYRRNRYADALKRAFAAYRALKRSSEHELVGDIQLLIANCYHRLGRLSEAEEYFNDALATYRRIECRRGMAWVHNNLGLLHKMACRWSRAIASLRRSLDIAVDVGMSQHVVLVQLNLGAVYLRTRRFAEAIASLRAAREGAEQIGDPLNEARALLMLGRAHTAMGSLARAERALMRGRQIAESREFRRELALADEFVGELMIARGRLHEARVNLLGALREAERIAPEGDVVVECLRRLAEVELRLGNVAQADAYLERGFELAPGAERFEMGFLHRVRAQRLAGEGAWGEAEAEARRAVEAFEAAGLDHEAGRALRLVARCAERAGGEDARSRTLRALGDAVAAFERAEEPAQEVACHVLAAAVARRAGRFDDALAELCEADRLVEEDCCDRFRTALRAARKAVERAMTRSNARVVDRFAVLGDLRQAIRSREDFERALASTLETMLERLGADSGFIAIPEADGPGIAPVVRHGMGARAARSAMTWYRRRAEARRALVVSDLSHDDAWAELRRRVRPGQGSLIFHRLGFDDRDLGVLCVHRHDESEAFGHDAASFVSAYASLISLTVFELVRSERRRRRRRPEAAARGFEGVVTADEGMIRLLALAERVAHSDATVLLQGETGTGKGLIAYAIHMLSDRRDRPFVHVNCAALPEQLLESELFGHVRGAFTGAFADKVGLLEQADGGTVFLDEIGKTSLVMQGKLLQFLDNSKVRRVGSNDYTTVDVRVICASKANLQKMVDEGRFLEDFFYRINDFPLVVPPLRERREDIPLLARHYIERIASDMGRDIDGATDAFIDALRAWHWPGNVRELEKVIKRAIILADDGEPLDLEHLPPELLGRRGAGAPGEAADELTTLRERIERLERAEIARALQRTAGNKSRAARELGISYPNLLAKIRRYNIQ